MIRAVVDANVWVSAFLKPESTPGRLIGAWRRHEFEAHVASMTVVEVVRALSRPRLVEKYHVRWTEVLRFIGDLVAGGTVHDVSKAAPRCRDRTDDVLLELAIRLAPCRLVTGDADLLTDAALVASVQAQGVEIVTPAAFERVLQTASG